MILSLGKKVYDQTSIHEELGRCSPYYVVRDDLPATHDFQGDDEEERLRQIRHTGHEWYKDNKRVAQYCEDLPATRLPGRRGGRTSPPSSANRK
jgi:hypothetical protein